MGSKAGTGACSWLQALAPGSLRTDHTTRSRINSSIKKKKINKAHSVSLGVTEKQKVNFADQD